MFSTGGFLVGAALMQHERKKPRGGLFAELPVVMAEPMGEGAGSQG